MKQITLTPPEGTARFSECGQYRYELTRHVGDGGILNVIGLNPSKATAETNDQTITQLMERARRLSFGMLVVTNIFAFRTTYPKEMRQASDPIGPYNDQAILDAARTADMILCAWGADGKFKRRGEHVRTMLTRLDLPLWALLQLDSGEPHHPLYVPYSKKPERYCWDGKGALL